jgi:hypothetical protein
VCRRLFANGSTPFIENVPKVGLNPVTPQYDAGRKTEPFVCVPSASGTMPAATAAADPLELPPGVCSTLRGLRVGPGVIYANAVVCVLPRRTAPRFLSSVMMSASSTPTRPR